MSKLPIVWKNPEVDNLTVVYRNQTASYELVDRIHGEELPPSHGRIPSTELFKWYQGNGFSFVKASGDHDLQTGQKVDIFTTDNTDARFPVVFRNKKQGIIEIVYRDRVEVYREKDSYGVGSQGRLYEEQSKSDFESFYRGNGFREVAP